MENSIISALYTLYFTFINTYSLNQRVYETLKKDVLVLIVFSTTWCILSANEWDKDDEQTTKLSIQNVDIPVTLVLKMSGLRESKYF